MITRRGDDDYVVIEDYTGIPPFFCTVTTDADLWLFISSTGGLTAGRREPDYAIFPYQPVDKIHDSITNTGPVNLFRWDSGGALRLWEPFRPDLAVPGRASRRMLKNLAGTRIVFEESLPDEGLFFSAAWTLSERFGVVRECRLLNTGPQPRRIEVLHGLRNLLADGITRKLQAEFSCLANAYKQNEILEPSGLGVFSMASGITDHPVPFEALRATVAWASGLPAARRTVDPAVIDAFRSGAAFCGGSASRGVRAHYLEWADLELAPGGEAFWMVVADTGLDHAAVSRLAGLLEGGLPIRDVGEDVIRCERNLRRHLASADGLQHGGDPVAAAHHMANVLFNVMRGGIFPAGYELDSGDFNAFVAGANRAVAATHAALLHALPAQISRSALRDRVEATGDPQLVRLFLEYLPLTFSRRHGDPSRPWNHFSIRIRDQQGGNILAYQGNWRDIFQNWEALALSFPEYVDSMIGKFVNASTADGYNPYRITRDGIDWEEPEPENPWAAFGYWGDHQIIYLLKLLEISHSHYPGQLTGLLGRPIFTYANVPYRIKAYRDILADPRNTLVCDEKVSARLREQARLHGSDRKLVTGPDGNPALVNLAEKLLVPLLAKWCNFVPGGGIWMNTQRPEWNDANNALVGNGLSMVTLCYLRRHQAFLARLFAAGDASAYAVSGPVAALLRSLHAILGAGDPARACADAAARRAILDQLGEAGTVHREALTRPDWMLPEAVSTVEIQALLETLQAWTDRTIRCNLREDGLYHAYNLLALRDGAAEIRRLDPMLEGQVAVLSSGLLCAAETSRLLDSLRASPLYCPRRNSYVLYPDRQTTPFTGKNRLPGAATAGSRLLREMLARGDHRLVVPDPHGSCLRFHPDFHDASILAAQMRGIGAEGIYGDVTAGERQAVLDLYESVFHHHAFTGRSGSMFAYEGLGSIYWHMVSKLLLAVQEILYQAVHDGADPALIGRLDAQYESIRDGLGFRKTAREYGAFPTDPYSHTPAHTGARQPGMTGQVKEEILTRRGELGVRVEDGRIAFKPLHRLVGREFIATEAEFGHVALGGAAHRLPLPAGSLAFTLCQTPVVCRHAAGAAGPGITLHRDDGSSSRLDGTVLDPESSLSLFRREGRIRLIEVDLAP